MQTLEISLTEQIKTPDWQYTEFLMRAWSEPDLADRYREEPVAYWDLRTHPQARVVTGPDRTRWH